MREVRHGLDHSVVVLEGELDLYNSDAVRETLARESARRPRRLVVDLSRVSFIDSTALHVLLAARKLLPDWRALVVRAPSPAVRRTLAVSGADRVLTVHDDWEAVA